MATFTGLSLNYGLSGNGTTTNTNVDVFGRVGKANTAQQYATADIAYSFEVTATGATDVATLDLAGGGVTQTTGTPTITDAGALFDGSDIPTAIKIYGMLFEFITVGADVIEVTGHCEVTGRVAGQVFEIGYNTSTSDLTDPIITFAEIGQKVRVTVVAATV